MRTSTILYTILCVSVFLGLLTGVIFQSWLPYVASRHHKLSIPQVKGNSPNSKAGGSRSINEKTVQQSNVIEETDHAFTRPAIFPASVHNQLADCMLCTLSIPSDGVDISDGPMAELEQFPRLNLRGGPNKLSHDVTAYGCKFIIVLRNDLRLSLRHEIRHQVTPANYLCTYLFDHPSISFLWFPMKIGFEAVSGNANSKALENSTVLKQVMDPVKMRDVTDLYRARFLDAFLFSVDPHLSDFLSVGCLWNDLKKEELGLDTHTDLRKLALHAHEALWEVFWGASMQMSAHLYVEPSNHVAYYLSLPSEETFLSWHDYIRSAAESADLLATISPSCFQKLQSFVQYSLQNKTALSKEAGIQLVVHIFGYNRPEALKSVLEDLERANPVSITVKLIIHIDHAVNDANNLNKRTLTLAQAHRSRHGNVTVLKASSHLGLRDSILTSWKANHDNEYALFLEDDLELHGQILEVAEHFILGLLQRDPLHRIAGISFYNPLYNEHTGLFLDDEQRPEHRTAYLMQQSASWGILLEPHRWREFCTWIYQTGQHDPKWEPMLPYSMANRWPRWLSWKKYHNRFLLDNNLYMLVTSPHGKMSLSRSKVLSGSNVIATESQFWKAVHHVEFPPLDSRSAFSPQETLYQLPFFNHLLEHIPLSSALRGIQLSGVEVSRSGTHIQAGRQYEDTCLVAIDVRAGDLSLLKQTLEHYARMSSLLAKDGWILFYGEKNITDVLNVLEEKWRSRLKLVKEPWNGHYEYPAPRCVFMVSSNVLLSDHSLRMLVLVWQQQFFDSVVAPGYAVCSLTSNLTDSWNCDPVHLIRLGFASLADPRFGLVVSSDAFSRASIEMTALIAQSSDDHSYQSISDCFSLMLNLAAPPKKGILAAPVWVNLNRDTGVPLNLKPGEHFSYCLNFYHKTVRPLSEVIGYSLTAITPSEQMVVPLKSSHIMESGKIVDLGFSHTGADTEGGRFRFIPQPFENQNGVCVSCVADVLSGFSTGYDPDLFTARNFLALLLRGSEHQHGITDKEFLCLVARACTLAGDCTAATPAAVCGVRSSVRIYEGLGILGSGLDIEAPTLLDCIDACIREIRCEVGQWRLPNHPDGKTCRLIFSYSSHDWWGAYHLAILPIR